MFTSRFVGSLWLLRFICCWDGFSFAPRTPDQTVILFRTRKFYCWQNIQRDAKRNEKTGESVWPLDRPLTRKWSQSNRIYYNQHLPYSVLCTEIHCEEGEATRKVRGMGNWWRYPQDVSKETQWIIIATNHLLRITSNKDLRQSDGKFVKTVGVVDDKVKEVCDYICTPNSWSFSYVTLTV